MTTHAKKAIKYYAIYFMHIENKYSILKQTRVHSSSGAGKGFGLVEILKIFKDMFDSSFNGKKLEEFQQIIRNYQNEYFNILTAIYKDSKNKDTKSSIEALTNEVLKIRSQKPNEASLNTFDGLLRQMDKTESHLDESISSFDKEIESFDKKEFIKSFKHFFEIYEKYRCLIKNTNPEHTHSDDVIIIEFIQSLTHLSYCYFANNLKDKNENYINENLRKASGHLERAILDIYKIILNIYILNDHLNPEMKLCLIEARQTEIDNISCRNNTATTKYEKLIKNIIN